MLRRTFCRSRFLSLKLFLSSTLSYKDWWLPWLPQLPTPPQTRSAVASPGDSFPFCTGQECGVIKGFSFLVSLLSGTAILHCVILSKLSTVTQIHADSLSGGQIWFPGRLKVMSSIPGTGKRKKKAKPFFYCHFTVISPLKLTETLNMLSLLFSRPSWVSVLRYSLSREKSFISEYNFLDNFRQWVPSLHSALGGRMKQEGCGAVGCTHRPETGSCCR